MPDSICSIDGCERPTQARGWCHAHYQRWRTNGDPGDAVVRTQLPPTPENFWLRTEPAGECVVWTGTIDAKGYGASWWNGTRVKAHRLAFYLRMGRWPDGILRHLCNNPPCVLHAVEGTYSENGLDAVAAGTNPQARKTHCPRGHPYDEANTYRQRNGGRVCRACGRLFAGRRRPPA